MAGILGEMSACLDMEVSGKGLIFHRRIFGGFQFFREMSREFSGG